MDIIINQKKFSAALRAVEKIVSKNTTLPILNTVLLKTENSRLRLSSTNLEIGINYWIGAKVNTEGEIAVPARVLSEFVNNINDEKVNISTTNNTITIQSENYKTTILGMETTEFPLIPKIKNAVDFKINPTVFRDLLSSVVDSSSLSETRPELSGVYCSIHGNTIECAATDSFRLSERIVPFKNTINRSVILPRTTVVELTRILEGISNDVSVALSDNQIFVYNEDFELISRLIDGHYPDYKKVIPDKHVAIVKISKSELERNVRMASIFSSNISDIRIKATKDNLELKANNSEKGEIIANLPCSTHNTPFEISVNYHYLLDGLKVVPGNTVMLQFTGEGSPLVLRAEDRQDHTYVIMPLRS